MACLPVFLSVFLTACLDGGGGGTETESKVAGRVVDGQGNPSVGARVILRPADYLDDPVSSEDRSKRRQETVTDTRGRYSLGWIPAGDYRIEIAGSESGGAIRDFSLARDSAGLQLPSDTVKPRGSILGSFAPDSEAQLASFVQVFGMERLVKADHAGGFILYNLPEGSYDIRCSSLQPFRRDAVRRSILVTAGKQTAIDPVVLEKEAKLTFSVDAIGLKIDGLDSTNPVIFDNERWDNGVDNEYIWAKVSMGSLDLRGNIVTQEFEVSTTTIEKQIAAGNADLRAARLAGFTGIPAFIAGAEKRLSQPDSGGIDNLKASPSAGSDLIVAEARKATPEKPLVVVVGGPLTTVAQAYLTDPSIASRMVVAGVFSYNLQSADSLANYLVAKRCRFVQWGRTYTWGGKPDTAGLSAIPQTRMADRIRGHLSGGGKVLLGDLAPVAFLFHRNLWKTADWVKVSSTLEVQTASDITFDFLDIPLNANDWTGFAEEFYATLSDSRAYHAAAVPAKLEAEGFLGKSGAGTITTDSTIGAESMIYNAGSWTQYKISVAAGKSHMFTVRYHSVGGAKIGLSLTDPANPSVPVVGAVAAELDLPASEDWRETVLKGMDLPAGTYTLRLTGLSGTCVLDWIDVAPAAP